MENIGAAMPPSFANIKEFVVQQILLDEFGHIIESDNKLLDSHIFRQKAIPEVCPFFESIFPYLQTLKEDTEDVYFPSVGLYIEDNFQGYFHYTFSKVHYQESIVLLWTIIKDKNASERQRIQQIRNKEILELELLHL